MNKIRAGLLGFGKTGSLVARELLNDARFSLSWVIRKSTHETEKFASKLLNFSHNAAPMYSASEINDQFHDDNPVDVIIDFSDASGINLYQKPVERGVKIVSAISKYESSQISQIQEYANHTAIVHSPNITVGANFLIVASRLLKMIAPHADVEIVETHFKNKPEVSGTALKMAHALGMEGDRVHSLRAGGVVGKHEVVFGLPNQTIRLIHESINRSAFGQGAIFAALWLQDKSKGLFSMENIFTQLLSGSSFTDLAIEGE
ncbi:4-hydroxy-tetrahydrodipicolinate reductase [Filimonas lacunae]|uniref:4-hydroxy-tetrahydrodipicolinate reductase n=1 Tax=Filimonas lacunae TaxID=477680 RepID=A0A173MIV4_9BACT|nr:dihydrodipicolinate reductase C-terminal domain-containing protein [Filimonas lacunae]BAV07341.1 4-hydroxy-tetrahydrodipicolinate reductase [Filimonas lacunae]SIS91080.1 4-hydroxy-tetrahydrodipicolinate reductase [Filimonas lacunae]